jgi:hypothetical protein
MSMIEESEVLVLVPHFPKTRLIRPNPIFDAQSRSENSFQVGDEHQLWVRSNACETIASGGNWEYIGS